MIGSAREDMYLEHDGQCAVSANPLCYCYKYKYRSIMNAMNLFYAGAADRCAMQVWMLVRFRYKYWRGHVSYRIVGASVFLLVYHKSTRTDH